MMAVEFDPRCSTAQPEDSVRLYLPRGVVNQEVPTNRRLSTAESSSEDQDMNLSYVAILDKYSGRENWPKKALILPGMNREPIQIGIKAKLINEQNITCYRQIFQLLSRKRSSIFSRDSFRLRSSR
jgi:hypothetical protein